MYVRPYGTCAIDCVYRCDRAARALLLILVRARFRRAALGGGALCGNSADALRRDLNIGTRRSGPGYARGGHTTAAEGGDRGEGVVRWVRRVRRVRFCPGSTARLEAGGAGRASLVQPGLALALRPLQHELHVAGVAPRLAQRRGERGGVARAVDSCRHLRGRG